MPEVIHGAGQKQKSRQSRKKRGYYAEQFFKTKANKARKAAKRATKKAYWNKVKMIENR